MPVLGIDVGTGGTRALVVDETGRILASATEEHLPFASPQPAWAEQDPRDWWRASTIAIRKALAAASVSPTSISCVGFSGQMHGAVLLDERDEVIRPALIWCDQRTQPQCDELHELFGRDRLMEFIGDHDCSVEKLLDAICDFRGRRDLEDDATVILLRSA